MLSDLHMRWLESRGISPETADRYGVYTGSYYGEDAVVFPFLEGGEAVNEKFRTKGKKFHQRKGGKKTFWNADILDDPALADGSQALIITEGEMDALSALECGFPFVVSVPEGAPGPNDRESDDDATGKFQFMFNNRDRLKRVKRFILAVDNDPSGRKLAAELVRRLGAGRCSFVTYPEEPLVLDKDTGELRAPKDLNEVLVKIDATGVRSVIEAARPYPVRGLYQFSDYPPPAPLQTIGTGWATVDKHLSMFPGCMEVITGIPGHGKTTWAMNRAVHAARNHGWKTVVFSPEMPVMPYFLDKLRRIVSGLPLYRLEQDRSLLRRTDQFINEHFLIIGNDPEGDGLDEDMTLEWLLERTEDAVHRFGVRHSIWDPWNEIEHYKPPHESMPDYIGRGIRMSKRIAKKLQIHQTIIVHPTKAVGGEEPRIPNLYDCEGSAHWFNKPDLGVIVCRDPENPLGNETIIRVAKVRFQETGERGDIRMRFCRDTEQFQMLDPSYNPYQEAAE